MVTTPLDAWLVGIGDNMSWFDIVKINPLEQQLRMRQRLGTVMPQSPEAQKVCARCGSTNFMRGDLDPEGKEICALCKKRFYAAAGA